MVPVIEWENEWENLLQRGTGSLHFLPTFKTFGAFIHLGVSMLAAIMTGTCATGHETHSDPTPFLTYITVFFSFRFRHLASPSFGVCYFNKCQA